MFFVAPPLQRFVEQAMGGRWRTFKLQFICFVVLILGSGIRGSLSLNLEGSNLLKFKANVDSDPFNSLASWDPEDDHPCNWNGVQCVDGKVHILDLSGLSLRGTLAPELGYLDDLRALILHTNHLSGFIPVEFGYLTNLEVLDLSDNNLTGAVPAEIAKIASLKRLLLCDNNLQGIIPSELEEHSSLSELQYDEYLASVTNRKIGNRPKITTESFLGQGGDQTGNLETSYERHMLQNVNVLASVTRRKLSDQSNLEALPATNGPVAEANSQPILRSSGAYSAVVDEKSLSRPPPSLPPDPDSQQEKTPAQPASTAQSNANTGRPSQKVWVSVAIGLGVLFLLAIAAALYFMWRRGAKPIGPFKTGISGQLQKAFVTGVPKLNRAELETACEDFSNIIVTFDAFTIYKGTLSSGVEIAVASTLVTASADWSDAAELAYRKKIEKLSWVNHKNFVNLLGYCEENEPFTRMMVFEYAPNGSVFEHLHVREVEHLDWNSRVRIIMGAAYCLQYMHHDLNPPVTHANLRSTAIYLTDDYAAKLAERPFENIPKASESGEDGSKPADLTKQPDPRQNILEFGILLLEIVTGRLPYSEEEGSLVDWALEYLYDRDNYRELIDPLLKSVKSDELDVICDVIMQCIRTEPKHRPTMKQITNKLREEILITPEAAVPRLSPLWWAELEILSLEST